MGRGRWSYLNRAAFAQPVPGAFGNFERNSLEGPRFWKIDLAVTRLLPVTSTHTLEVRVEVFNLLNNFNWGLPGTPAQPGGAQETYVDFGAAAFGRILQAAGDPRIIQFGIKYAF